MQCSASTHAINIGNSAYRSNNAPSNSRTRRTCRVCIFATHLNASPASSPNSRITHSTNAPCPINSRPIATQSAAASINSRTSTSAGNAQSNSYSNNAANVSTRISARRRRKYSVVETPANAPPQEPQAHSANRCVIRMALSPSANGNAQFAPNPTSNSRAHRPPIRASTSFPNSTAIGFGRAAQLSG